MKRLVKGLAVIAFLVIASYGLTQFLEAQEARRTLADAELFCAEHGGVGRIATESGEIIQVECVDGTRFMPGAGATPRE